MRAVIRHVRSNAVAYAALFVALGGTGYAAMSLPKGSVGARQIKNHSIAPVKFNGKSITGSVRAWAVVNSNGKVISGGGKPKGAGTVTPGVFNISWGVNLGRNCATVATIDSKHSGATESIPIPGQASAPFTAGYTVVEGFHQGDGRRNNATFVHTFDQAGRLVPLGFDVEVVC